jgi:hypothetical protein
MFWEFHRGLEATDRTVGNATVALNCNVPTAQCEWMNDRFGTGKLEATTP